MSSQVTTWTDTMSRAMPSAGESVLRPSTAAPRRRLSERQAATVHALAVAALEELRSAGYDGLTVRRVAARAGVAPATAYTYFASKDHLITEVFWRRLTALPEPAVDRRLRPDRRLAAALGELARMLGEEPELSAACTTAMLGSDPDVVRLRLRIAEEIRRRSTLALGEGAHPATVQAMDLMVSGAFLAAGMGHLGYDELEGLLAEMATVAVRGPR